MGRIIALPAGLQAFLVAVQHGHGNASAGNRLTHKAF
jgi:hypothetical protein